MGTENKSRGAELVAKRWAKALMELLQENSGVSKDDVLDDLLEVNENIQSSRELSDILKNPSVSLEEKEVVLSKLFENKLMPVSFTFLKLLNSKSRLDILEEVSDEFKKELEDLNNIVQVQVTSAIELSDEKKNYVRDNIARKLEKDVRPSWVVDSSIIGGLIVNINETIIDSSIKSKLENISNSIVKG